MNTQEWNPGRLLETSGYYWKTCTLHAGVKLDVFTTIGDAHLRIEDIASNLGGSKRRRNASQCTDSHESANKNR